MKKTFCDACGKEIKEKDIIALVKFVRKQQKFNRSIFDTGSVPDSMEVCKECCGCYKEKGE